MPSRRSHVNSHHGCAQCKARKIKCDETRPVCRKCTKRGIQCTNEKNPFGPISLSRAASPVGNRCFSKNVQTCPTPWTTFDSPVLRPSLPCDNSSLVTSSPLSLPLIHLMHHYTLHTAPTFCDYPFLLPLWQSVIPSLALANPFLLHSIAALSSMHLAYLSPPCDSHAYHQAALFHQDAALTLIRPSINDINPKNASALLVSAFFVPIFDFAWRSPPSSPLMSLSSTSTSPLRSPLGFPLHPTHHPSNSNALTCDPSSFTHHSITPLTQHSRNDVLAQLQTIFNLFRGILAIMDVSFDWLRAGPLASLLTQYFPDDAPPASLDVESALDRLDAFSASYSCRSQSQPQPQNQEQIQNQNQHEKGKGDCSEEAPVPACEKAIRELRVAFRNAHTAPGRFSAIFKWAVIVDDGFLAAVRAEEEPALCVLGLYGVLFHGLDACWWTRGWGVALVEAVEERVKMREGRELLRWANEKLGRKEKDCIGIEM